VLRKQHVVLLFKPEFEQCLYNCVVGVCHVQRMLGVISECLRAVCKLHIALSVLTGASMDLHIHSHSWSLSFSASSNA
jgi:hypothetical protein